MNQIIVGNGLQRLSGVAPGGEPAYDDKSVESSFPQQVRHPGARGFALSSTVDVNVLILWKQLDFFSKIVGLDSN
jgi:hypothetical protein